MSSKSKTLGNDEKKILLALQRENDKVLSEAKEGKRPDLTRLNELTNQWRKVRGLPELKRKPKPEEKKKEDFTDTPPSSPIIIETPIVVDKVPEKSLELNMTSDKSVTEKPKKKKLVNVPKKVKAEEKADTKEDAVIVEKPKERDHKFEELLKLFESLPQDQREKLIRSGQAPKSGWSLFG